MLLDSREREDLSGLSAGTVGENTDDDDGAEGSGGWKIGGD
jgi:hypothetical protein